MKAINSYAALEDLGRVRLSRHFFMRDFLHSEIAAWHGLRNIPDDPDRAIAMGRELCTELLEPLQATFGRIHIRSGYRSPEVNRFGNENRMNCASNDRNHGRHIWDYPDAAGHGGAMACIVVPWLVDYVGRGGSWMAMAWWIHDHLPYGILCFFPGLSAFNIGWQEVPERRIDSHVRPKGCLTRPGMDNHAGSHAAFYPSFPSLVRLEPGRRTGSEPVAPRVQSADKGASRRAAAGAAAAPVKTGESTLVADRAAVLEDPASTGGKVRYRAVHTRTTWRRVNNHGSLASAIHGPNGAVALFRGKVRIDYRKHGDPLFVLVWQDGASSGYAFKRDATSGDGVRQVSVPMADLQRFESGGGANLAALERCFR